MNKNIWIINDYAGSPYHGMEFRHYYLGKELIKLGCSVHIISSNYSHLFNKLPEESKENIDGIDYLWLKTLNYGNSHNKKRALKWFIFAFRLFSLPFKLKKPDVIIVSPMAPFPIAPSWVLTKIFKCKLIYEVKDIWPLSLVELGGISSSHPFIVLMGWFEKFAVKNSDVVVSNLPNYGEHVKKNLKLSKTVEWISNGVDLGELEKNDPLEERFSSRIPKDKFVVGYTGSIGVANALDFFCQSAELLRNHKNIVFVIVGEGQEKNTLINSYKHLDNLLFIDGIPKRQVQGMLNLFNSCFLGLKRESLFRYGVSPNKLFEYMFSSKPVIYAIDSGNINLVEIAKCGLSVEAGNVEAIVSGILKLYRMSASEQIQLGKNGRRYVLENFTYDKLAQSYKQLL
jgi:glycosyltransferase involved in cell wall biosynthesis